jgi:hypothetical protein
MKKYISLFVFLLGLLVFQGCVDRKFDEPPAPTIPTGNVLTISDLYQIYADSGRYTFTGDYSVYAVVSMDEKSGNIYKNVYVQDGEKGIDLHLLSSGGLYQGDSIRIYLKGLVIDNYNGIMQLDSVDVDKNIVKQATDVEVQPIVVSSISQLNDDLLCKLIKLENVQFLFSDTNKTFADAVNRVSENRTLEDCDGNQLIVRTSGYAKFAGYSVPDGNGSMVGIFSKYGSDYQFLIRSYSEVDMNGERCGSVVYLYKDFSDNSLTSGGWANVNVAGNVNWEVSSSYGNPAPGATISNYNNGVNTACETWFISPAVDLSNTTFPVLDFDNAYNYTGDPLKVYISTDYDGNGDPTTATWTELSFNASLGGFNWTNSGDIDISAYKQANVHVAFVYTGTDTNGSTWEIDNIEIKEAE